MQRNQQSQPKLRPDVAFAYPLSIRNHSAAILTPFKSNASSLRKLHVSWANSEADLRAAQQLRYQIFALEMGAQLPSAADVNGLDVDYFDAFCEHLLVRAVDEDGQPGMLVGTYRALSPDAAKRAGGLYADGEFDLHPLKNLRGKMVELGRSCVHADWRSGNVILLLWAALGQYMLQHKLDTMIGCASMALGHHSNTVSDVWQYVSRHYLVSPQWRIKPHPALSIQPALDVKEDYASHFCEHTPPLIKGYLRCGARLLGPPALDAYFNAADFPIMLRLADLTPRYRQHFLGKHVGNG
jgi:hypothetical protein